MKNCISRRSFLKAAGILGAAGALAACGSSSSSTTTASSTAASAAADNTPSNKGTGVTLNVYTNSDTDGRDEWLIERAAQDGFKVQGVGAGAADTQNRLLAEKASPIADVVFGLNAIIWESLKAENILIPFVPEWADEIPAGLNDDEGYYHAIVKQAILLVYDQNQLTEDQAPTDWPDLWTKPEFDKKYEYLTSLAGGTVRNVITGMLTPTVIWALHRKAGMPSPSTTSTVCPMRTAWTCTHRSPARTAPLSVVRCGPPALRPATISTVSRPATQFPMLAFPMQLRALPS